MPNFVLEFCSIIAQKILYMKFTQAQTLYHPLKVTFGILK